MSSSDAVVLREVGLRDGLLILPRVVPTATMREWLRAAYDAGLSELEVGSFVQPKAMPQLADTAELVAYARTLPGCVPSVLVPLALSRTRTGFRSTASETTTGNG